MTGFKHRKTARAESRMAPDGRREAVTPCAQCPLRALAAFRPFSAEELHFISTFKVGEVRFAPGDPILIENQQSPFLYTVLSGWTMKSKALDDGRRQIINYALPGHVRQAGVNSRMA